MHIMSVSCSVQLPVKCEQFDSISLTLPVGVPQV